MECFLHPSQTAVATCRSCGRAVCRSCARDLGFAIVCSDACATDASQLREMNERSKNLYGIGTTKRRVPLGPLMWGLFALLFGGAGVARWYVDGEVEWFLLMFGVVSTIIAIVSYRRVKDLQLNC